MIGKRWSVLGGAALAALILVSAAGAHAEYNPVSTRPVSIGPAAGRLIVGFRATSSNTVVQTIHSQTRGTTINIGQARTDAGDLAALTQRVGLRVAKSRQLTSSMHVIHLQKTLYGADVAAALNALRGDPAVEFAEVDQRRYPHATMPNDPLFQASANATGQWFMLTPSTLTPTSDAAATDAVSAWDITKGSTGTVIADVDTGVLFDHPDLLRAGFGGRLLPGYDFVSGDVNPNSPYNSLGTFLIANDGDGWDPDPSDPGDWISATDEKNVLFPAASCGGPNGAPTDSSWHGTRVMGILGALTDNSVGIAGMTWNPYLLPVRALGKCGGYDSDIITGMQWAAGMSITGVPNNPYPADIINLSLGGPGSCPTAYADAVTALNALGVLIVASAGNESGLPVDAPANCAGVLGVAGLRNVGTKVGYSNLGPQLGIAAPAGNCVNSSGPCLKSIDTTTNTGLTTPAANTYTDQSNPNLGTSFSAPIVSGIAALMRAVNANLTPVQLIARIESSATAFPQPAALIASGYVCPTADPASGECACPNDHSQCGYGMANALNAVKAAQRPIAAVVVPTSSSVGSAAVLDASGSAASCLRTIASYAWTANPSSLIPPGSTGAQVTVTPNGTAGTVTLVVTDSSGDTDTATLSVAAGGAITKAAATPASAGTSAGACPTPLTVTTSAPTVTEAFSPASVGENVASTLTITFSNANGFDLTQSGFTETVPANLTVQTSPAPTTTCSGASATLTSSASTVTLAGANIPAKGSCSMTMSVKSATAGSYANTIAANALSTASAGGNSASVSTSLAVTAPPSKGGGGDLDWWDTLFVVGVLLAGRRHTKRRPQRP
jgi:serine protease